jgi:hypothetical protein
VCCHGFSPSVRHSSKRYARICTRVRAATSSGIPGLFTSCTVFSFAMKLVTGCRVTKIQRQADHPSS